MSWKWQQKTWETMMQQKQQSKPHPLYDQASESLSNPATPSVSWQAVFSESIKDVGQQEPPTTVAGSIALSVYSSSAHNIFGGTLVLSTIDREACALLVKAIPDDWIFSGFNELRDNPANHQTLIAMYNDRLPNKEAAAAWFQRALELSL